MPFDAHVEGYEVRTLLYNLPDSYKFEFPQQNLFKKFPHVFEKLNGLWGSIECYEYLNELVVNECDRRRKGFPAEVIEELVWLGIQHTVVPEQIDPWGSNPKVL